MLPNLNVNRICILIVFMLFALKTTKADVWITSYEEAKKLALSTNKLILVDFWASWCGPCKKMDSESWSKNDVRQVMNYYIPVKIDIDRNRNIAKQYGIKGIPHVFIMDANGKVIHSEMGYRNKKEVITLLNKYALTMAYLSEELNGYFKNPGFTTSYNLASKYQDFAVFINNKLKREFLRVSNEYLRESKRYLKKGELKNKSAFNQKIGLFSIQEKLILNKPEKALKLLKKLDENEIEDLNYSFYSFLYYTSYKALNDLESAALWENKLMDKELKKTEFILEHIL